MNIHLSSERSRRLREFSSMPRKQMYKDNDTIKSWIDSINHVSNSDDGDIFEIVTHPIHSHSPFSDKFDSEITASFLFDSSAWAPGILASSYQDESDESRSESSLSDDSDTQYITIPTDSPWYRPPPPSPGPATAYELSTGALTSSCSSDVRQAIAQQKVLLAVFYDELRRVVPHDDQLMYDPSWLGDVDADLVLAPLETYADLCWESAVCDKSSDPRSDRPIPDVPIGFDDLGPY